MCKQRIGLSVETLFLSQSHFTRALCLVSEGCHSLLLILVHCMCVCVCVFVLPCQFFSQFALRMKTEKDLYEDLWCPLWARREWGNFISVVPCQNIFITLIDCLIESIVRDPSEDLHKSFSRGWLNLYLKDMTVP